MQGKIRRWAYEAIHSAHDQSLLLLLATADPDRRPGDTWQASASRALCGLIRISGRPLDPCVLVLYATLRSSDCETLKALITGFTIVEDSDETTWGTDGNGHREQDPGQLAQPV